MSRNIPEIMEKISCFLCKKQDKLFIKIGLVCESENRPHSPFRNFVPAKRAKAVYGGTGTMAMAGAGDG